MLDGFASTCSAPVVHVEIEVPPGVFTEYEMIGPLRASVAQAGGASGAVDAEQAHGWLDVQANRGALGSC